MKLRNDGYTNEIGGGEEEERSTIVIIVVYCDTLALDDKTIDDNIYVTEAVRFDIKVLFSFPDRLHHIGVVAAIWVKNLIQLRLCCY